MSDDFQIRIDLVDCLEATLKGHQTLDRSKLDKIVPSKAYGMGATRYHEVLNGVCAAMRSKGWPQRGYTVNDRSLDDAVKYVDKPLTAALFLIAQDIYRSNPLNRVTTALKSAPVMLLAGGVAGAVITRAVRKAARS